jgi:hypothetical protein
MRRLAIAALAGLATACSTAKVIDTPGDGSAPLCKPGVSLGKVAVTPLTHWRPDQKEPAVREAIAQAAIEAAVKTMPCAQSVTVSPISADTQADAALAAARAGGADTAIQIRVQELGPIAILSLPVLWSTWSDVKFEFKAVSLATNQTLFDIDRRRTVGGAFNVRGLGPLQAEMETALADLIVGARPSGN